jgi:hypothetical protein
LVSDIPAGDGKIDHPFLQCMDSGAPPESCKYLDIFILKAEEAEGPEPVLHSHQNHVFVHKVVGADLSQETVIKGPVSRLTRKFFCFLLGVAKLIRVKRTGIAHLGWRGSLGEGRSSLVRMTYFYFYPIFTCLCSPIFFGL